MATEEGAQSEKPQRGRRKNPKQTRKIQLNLTDPYISDLEELSGVLRENTQSGTIRKLIRIGKLLTRLSSPQGEITILGENGEKTILVFA